MSKFLIIVKNCQKVPSVSDRVTRSPIELFWTAENTGFHISYSEIDIYTEIPSKSEKGFHKCKSRGWGRGGSVKSFHKKRYFLNDAIPI